MAAIDDLLASLGAVGDTVKQITDKRAQLQGYKDTRDQYAALVQSTKADLDTLTGNAKAALQDLAAKINAQFPPGT